MSNMKTKILKLSNIELLFPRLRALKNHALRLFIEKN